MKVIIKIIGFTLGLFALLLLWGWLKSSPEDRHYVSSWEQAAIDSTKQFYGDGVPSIQPLRKENNDPYRRLLITHKHFERPDLLFDFAFDYCLYFTIREKEQSCFLVFYKYNGEISDESELGRPVAKFSYVPNTSYTESTLIDKGKTYSTKDGSLYMYMDERKLPWGKKKESDATKESGSDK